MNDPSSSSPRPLAVITGGSSGIGLAFARQLAARGYDLLLVARDADRLRSTAAEVGREFGIDATAWPADLTRAEDVASLANHLAAQERLGVLVNNAGFGTKGRFATRPLGEQAAMLALHVSAPMVLTHAALPGMIARRAGLVITVSSVASFTASMGNVNYCATKAYQRVMLEALAMELTDTGVKVQALCPGFTHTEFHDRASITKSTVPSWLWLSADRVVRESLDRAFGSGPVVVVPGRRYRTLVFVLRHLPRLTQWLVQGRYGKARV